MADCVCKLMNVLLFIVFSVYFLDITNAQQQAHIKPAAEFSKHTLIKTKIYHGREKRQISSKNEKIGVDFITVQYRIGDINHILDLKLNKQLLPKGYFRKYQKNGEYVTDRPSMYDVDLCHYHGKIRDIPNSWAAISTCDGSLKGVVFDGKELNHIEKAHNGELHLLDQHFLYKHSDLIETNNKSCGYHGTHEHLLETSRKEDNLVPKRFKRAANDAKIRGPYNANKLSRYVELVLVIDNREYKDLGENLQRVYQHCKDIANIINGLYSSLNIFIALVGVVVWTERDEIELSPKGDTTLTNFLHYRREILIKEHPNDNAQLLTKYTFDGGVVGKALKGPICTFEYSGGVSMDHSHVIGLVATTVAHEMGHNFGMEHDTNDCDCPDERCIMAPSSSSSSPTHWSSCSLEYLALAFEHGMDYCLRNKPVELFDSPVCGNGFVEPGEQCDCGLPQTCDNTCCNATTCMLYSNATCATGECCDLKTCRPKTAGSLCRAADYECDLPEYCTGESEYCPADVYKLDTEECDGGRAFCYHGSCRTRTDQCRLLWGNTGKSSDDQCYSMNVKGSRHGNCGYHRVNQSFIKCEDENVLCGMLHCRHLNERLEFGMESVAILSQSFINLKGNIIPCRTALVDLGLNQVDPGLAPDGASCGKGKMCVNQKCMSVESLRASIDKCPHDCNGNGVCNSLGHCHCKDDFSPPFCDYPGPGGSEDSGPASDPNARKDFIKAMYIIFLGIIPTLAIIVLLIYYPRYHMKFKWPAGGSTGKSTKPKSPKSRGNGFSSNHSNKRDDNSSLLQDNNQSCFQNEFFGQFKGFHITPIASSNNEENKIPTRAIGWSVPSSSNINTNTIASSNNEENKIPTRAIGWSVPSSPNINTNTNVNTGQKVPRSQTAPPVAMVKPQIHATENGNVINNNNPPALPPLNPGAHPRPLISSPILKASTCSAKELVSPLKNAPKVPVRPAPEVPEARPLSQPMVSLMIEEIQEKENKPKEPSTINRIASFLKSKDDKTKAQNGIKLNKKIDKDALKSIEISNPIPQNEIVVPSADSAEKKAVVMRAQSMRNANGPKPNIQSFGSMRQPGKRPTSIPVGNRPSSPPPRPPQPEIESKSNEKIPGVPGYQEPAKIGIKNVTSGAPVNKNITEEYDDCLNESPLAKISEESPTDNIYAVIEETPKSLGEKSHSTSNESFGLLGEIVSEIQNRNFDSIYSTSTLARKKKENMEREAKKALESSNENYVNTSSLYKSPVTENTYSNMGNLPSSASSTASGYITPAAVNVPVKNIPKTEKPEEKTLSTFKSEVNKKPEVSSYKPYHSTLQRNSGPLASTFKNTTTGIVKNSTEAPSNNTSTSNSATLKSAFLSTPISNPSYNNFTTVTADATSKTLNIDLKDTKNLGMDSQKGETKLSLGSNVIQNNATAKNTPEVKSTDVTKNITEVKNSTVKASNEKFAPNISTSNKSGTLLSNEKIGVPNSNNNAPLGLASDKSTPSQNLTSTTTTIGTNLSSSEKPMLPTKNIAPLAASEEFGLNSPKKSAPIPASSKTQNIEKVSIPPTLINNSVTGPKPETSGPKAAPGGKLTISAPISSTTTFNSSPLTDVANLTKNTTSVKPVVCEKPNLGNPKTPIGNQKPSNEAAISSAPKPVVPSEKPVLPPSFKPPISGTVLKSIDSSLTASAQVPIVPNNLTTTVSTFKGGPISPSATKSPTENSASTQSSNLVPTVLKNPLGATTTTKNEISAPKPTKSTKNPAPPVPVQGIKAILNRVNSKEGILTNTPQNSQISTPSEKNELKTPTAINLKSSLNTNTFGGSKNFTTSSNSKNSTDSNLLSGLGTESKLSTGANADPKSSIGSSIDSKLGTGGVSPVVSGGTTDIKSTTGTTTESKFTPESSIEVKSTSVPTKPSLNSNAGSKISNPSTTSSTYKTAPATSTLNTVFKGAPNSNFKGSVPKSEQSGLKSTPSSVVANSGSSNGSKNSTFKSAPFTNTVSSTLKNGVGNSNNSVNNSSSLKNSCSAEKLTTSQNDTKKTENTEVTKNKTSSSPIQSPTSKTPKFIGRQVTPVNLRTRKPSPVRTNNITSNNITAKNTTSKTNSPDLVISCSTATTNTKSPDVLNSSAKINSKPNGILPKPIVTPKILPKTVNSNVKSPTSNKIKSPPLVKSKINNSNDSKLINNSANSVINNKLLPNKTNNVQNTSPSTVATLQQKFENKNQTAKTK